MYILVNYVEVLVAAVGLLIAIWVLNLQRKEIIRNGRINSLIHTSFMLNEKIEFHRGIIDDMKNEGKKYAEWQGHEYRVNSVLRPLKKEVDREFLGLIAKYDRVLHEADIREVLDTRRS